jgi:hypothetical protein
MVLFCCLLLVTKIERFIYHFDFQSLMSPMLVQLAVAETQPGKIEILPINEVVDGGVHKGVDYFSVAPINPTWHLPELQVRLGADILTLDGKIDCVERESALRLIQVGLEKKGIYNLGPYLLDGQTPIDFSVIPDLSAQYS